MAAIFFCLTKLPHSIKSNFTLDYNFVVRHWMGWQITMAIVAACISQPINDHVFFHIQNGGCWPYQQDLLKIELATETDTEMKKRDARNHGRHKAPPIELNLIKVLISINFIKVSFCHVSFSLCRLIAGSAVFMHTTHRSWIKEFRWAAHNQLNFM